MGNNFKGAWNSGQPKPVIMTEDQAGEIVTAVLDGIREMNSGQLIEHYRQFAQTQVELQQAQAALARRDAEIAGLNQQIATLQSILTQVTSGRPQPSLNPYNTASTYAPLQVPPIYGGNGNGHHPEFTAVGTEG